MFRSSLRSIRHGSTALQRGVTTKAARATHYRAYATALNRGSSSPFLNTVGASHFGKRSYCSNDEHVVGEVPAMGDSIQSGTLAEWLFKVGDHVNEDDVLANVETDKIMVEIVAQASGTLVEVLAEEGDTVEVGAPVYKIKKGAAASKEAPKEDAPKENDAKESAPKQEAKTEAKKDDKKAAKKDDKKAAPSSTSPAGGSRTERRVPMTRMRLRIAERLKDSQNTAAMLTTFQECDMHNIMELRNTYKDDFQKKHGVKLGFMSGFVAAATAALKNSPTVNAVMDGSDLVYRDYVDISIAVAAPNGLVVPVLRNCDQMSFADIERGISELGEKARTGKLEMADMTGGSFTISNGGVFGSLMGTPIINPPQSAILGMHSIVKRPAVVNGEIVIRPMMYLALTYDHRIIDGREAVTFLRQIKQGVEDPRSLLLDL